jgi:GT2 family glycosyltransferase
VSNKSTGISIVIVTYNSAAYIVPCLESIYEQDVNFHFEVIVLDNASVDQTVSIIKNSFPQVKLIESKKNQGFTRGNNLGVKQSCLDYIFLLNPDTKLSNGVLTDLYIEIKKNKNQKTIILPMQLNYDTGQFLNCGLGLDIFGFPINEGVKANFFYADGAAIFMKKIDFLELGMFDDVMFLIQEDVDLSWKARLLGFSLIRAENILIFHKSGHSIDDQTDKSKSFSSSRFRRYYGERNSLRNILKNYSIINLIWILPITLTIVFVEILMFTVIGNPKAGLSYIQAYYWNVVNIRDTLKMRKWIQNRRTVSDLVILRAMYKGSAKLKLLLQVGIPKVKI